MKTGLTLLLLGLLVSATAGSAEPAAKVSRSAVTVRPTPAAGKVLVEITAVTLADDCGQGAEAGPAQAPRSPSVAPADRACEQTSMQLWVASDAASAATALTVKKVELYDEAGTLLGVLTTRAPRVWSENTYQRWDENVAPGQTLSVTYALSKPSISIGKRDKTYVLKAVVSVGGADQTLQRDIRISAQVIKRPPVPT